MAEQGSESKDGIVPNHHQGVCYLPIDNLHQSADCGAGQLALREIDGEELAGEGVEEWVGVL